MKPELSRHHHYQSVLLLNGWYRVDWSLWSMDLECCNKLAHLDQLEPMNRLSHGIVKYVHENFVMA